MIKQQSMLYTNNTPWERFPDLTPDQLLKVDNFVMRMKNGDEAEPADFLKLKQDN